MRREPVRAWTCVFKGLVLFDSADAQVAGILGKAPSGLQLVFESNNGDHVIVCCASYSGASLRGVGVRFPTFSHQGAQFSLLVFVLWRCCKVFQVITSRQCATLDTGFLQFLQDASCVLCPPRFSGTTFGPTVHLTLCHYFFGKNDTGFKLAGRFATILRRKQPRCFG